MTPKGQSQKDARMRREGYDDGRAGIPAKRKDAVYQRAWRKGWDAKTREQWNAHAERMRRELEDA